MLVTADPPPNSTPPLSHAAAQSDRTPATGDTDPVDRRQGTSRRPQ
jgi:hypothetical protein